MLSRPFDRFTVADSVRSDSDKPVFMPYFAPRLVRVLRRVYESATYGDP